MYVEKVGPLYYGAPFTQPVEDGNLTALFALSSV